MGGCIRRRKRSCDYGAVEGEGLDWVLLALNGIIWLFYTFILVLLIAASCLPWQVVWSRLQLAGLGWIHAQQNEQCYSSTTAFLEAYKPLYLRESRPKYLLFIVWWQRWMSRWRHHDVRVGCTLTSASVNAIWQMGPLYPGSTFQRILHLSLNVALGTSETKMNRRLQHTELLVSITIVTT